MFFSAFLHAWQARYPSRQTIDSKVPMSSSTPALTANIQQLLANAVMSSGRTSSEIARRAGMKRDSLRRTLASERPVTFDEVVRILEASGHASAETLTLALLVGNDFALTQSGTSSAKFLGELLRLAPAEIVAELGDGIDDLRPRWALGTAKMLARALSQHVAELNRRGDAIGERLPNARAD